MMLAKILVVTALVAGTVVSQPACAAETMDELTSLLDDLGELAEELADYAEARAREICPAQLLEREAMGGATFRHRGSTELYLYGCSIGATIVSVDRRDELCAKMPALLLRDPFVPVHVPLEEWEGRGDLPEAERIIVLGCVDGALGASGPGDASPEGEPQAADFLR